jgi:hypothetical protein
MMMAMRIRMVSWRELALFQEALWSLMRAEIATRAGYPAVRRQMSVAVNRAFHSDSQRTIPPVVTAVARACRYYPKSVACLQRSVALTSMLRKRGVAADLKIGVRQSPFESHAWVEVDGRIINDAESVRDAYEPLHEFKAEPCEHRGD